MSEVTMANIIKNLSDELYATVQKLKDTEAALTKSMDESNDWFNRWLEVKKELELVKGAERLTVELPDMEGLNNGNV